MHKSFVENILLVNMVDVSIPIKSVSCTFRKNSSFFPTIIYEAHAYFSHYLSCYGTYRKGKKERTKLPMGVGQLLHIIKEGKRQRMLKVELLWAP